MTKKEFTHVYKPYHKDISKTAVDLIREDRKMQAAEREAEKQQAREKHAELLSNLPALPQGYQWRVGSVEDELRVVDMSEPERPSVRFYVQRRDANWYCVLMVDGPVPNPSKWASVHIDVPGCDRADAAYVLADSIWQLHSESEKRAGLAETLKP